MPNVAYGSDIGLRVGVAGFVYRVAEVDPERRDRLSLGLAYSTRGPRFIEARWYDYRLLGTRAQTAWDLRLADDDLAPYWGEGARLGGLTVAPGSGGGGDVALAEAGLLLDTRDQEAGTRRGLYVNVSLFGSPALGGPFAYSFTGGNVTFRQYLPLLPGARLAMRVMADMKRGRVPFFERTIYEGVEFGDGLGGGETVRGVARYRLAGEDKLLANLELRMDLRTWHPFERSLDLGLGAGVDAGAAHQRNYSTVAALGGFAGVRLLWDEVILLRVELGYAAQGSAAVYISFGEEF